MFMRHAVRGTALLVTFLAACSDSRPIAPAETVKPAEQLVITTTPQRDSLAVGGTRAFRAIITTQFGEPRTPPVTWSSTAPGVLTIGADGMATAIAAGTAQVIASASGVADTSDVTVTALLATMQLLPNAVDLALGDSIVFSANFGGNASNAAIVGLEWATSDSTKARVDANGNVVALDTGDVQLIARSGAAEARAPIRVFRVPVVAVSIAPTVLSMAPGSTTRLTAVARDAIGRLVTDRPVWTTSHPHVATVDADGVVTAVSRGFAVVSAMVGGIRGSATVQTGPKPVGSVSVELGAGTIVEGQTTTVSATTKDLQGNTVAEQPVAWQSANPAIATVTSSGVVTGLVEGTTTISAISGGQTGATAVRVSKRVPTRIDISPAAPTVSIGSSSRLTVRVLDQNGSQIGSATATLSSTNPGVATIAQNGTLTGIAIGTTTIRATYNALSASVTASVTQVPVASLVIAPTSLSLDIGESGALKATTRAADGTVLSGRPVAWSSSNNGVATVNALGAVTGLSQGTATVTATSEGVSATADVTVNPPAPAPVASVVVTLNASRLRAGQTTQASAAIYDAAGNPLTGRAVSWSSSDASIATISSTGLVTAVGGGSASIRAAVEGIVGASAITVETEAPSAVASVDLQLASAEIGVGGTTGTTVVLRDAAGSLLTGRTVAYTSYAPSVATASSAGTVTGLAVGEARIAATAESVTDDAALRVSGTSSSTPVLTTLLVSASVTSLTVGQAVKVTATGRDQLGNPIATGSVTWSSSNVAVATVTSAGVVTAVSAGSATITARSGAIASAPLAFTVTSGGSAPAPVSSVTVTLNSPTIDVGQATQANAVTRDAGGNVLSGRSVYFSSSNTSVATVSSTGMVTAVGGGVATITATAEGVSGSASVTVNVPAPPPTSNPSGLQATPPALPQVYLNTGFVVPTGRQISVAPTQSLQRAIDTAQRGDVILLQPGATYTGAFILKAKSAGSGWITIMSSGSLPAEGTRFKPGTGYTLPKLVTNVTNTPVISTQAGASFYRLVGLEVTAPTNWTSLYALVTLGEGNSSQSTLASVPTDIILDRVWMHGHPTLHLQRCMTLNSARSAVIDSWLERCHAKGYDTQAILGYNGPGPFKIVNNFLEGAGENIMFGGADPWIPNLIPSDIEIRRNHFYKNPGWGTTTWTVKNLFELKMARRVLVEGNVFENHWVDAQAGSGIVWKSTNQDGRATWAQTSDVTFQYNVLRNTPGGINLAANPEAYPAVPAARFRVRHNLMYNVGSYMGTVNARAFLLLGGLRDIDISNNTVLSNATTGSGALFMLDAPSGGSNLVIRNNVAQGFGQYGSVIGGWGVGQGTAAINGFMSPWAFERNVVAEIPSNVRPAYPTNNAYPDLASAFGFVDRSTFNLALTTSSTYKGYGTDGKDPGADYTAVMSATAGVVMP